MKKITKKSGPKKLKSRIKLKGKIESIARELDRVIEKAIDDDIEPGEKLTGKQKRFCEEYIFDFNGARAARDAGYSEETARNIASENLTKPDIQAYIAELQANMEQTSGISRLRVLREHEKLAFSSIAHLHDTWITRKDFDQLTDEQKSCIAEIQTQTRQQSQLDPISGEIETIQIDFVKVKLYDKQKALDSISKILGFESAKKLDLTTKGEKIENPTVPIIKVFNTAPPMAGSEDEIEL